MLPKADASSPLEQRTGEVLSNIWSVHRFEGRSGRARSRSGERTARTQNHSERSGAWAYRDGFVPRRKDTEQIAQLSKLAPLERWERGRYCQCRVVLGGPRRRLDQRPDSARKWRVRLRTQATAGAWGKCCDRLSSFLKSDRHEREVFYETGNRNHRCFERFRRSCGKGTGEGGPYRLRKVCARQRRITLRKWRPPEVRRGKQCRSTHGRTGCAVAGFGRCGGRADRQRERTP